MGSISSIIWKFTEGSEDYPNNSNILSLFHCHRFVPNRVIIIIVIYLFIFCSWIIRRQTFTGTAQRDFCNVYMPWQTKENAKQAVFDKWENYFYCAMTEIHLWVLISSVGGLKGTRYIVLCLIFLNNSVWTFSKFCLAIYKWNKQV